MIISVGHSPEEIVKSIALAISLHLATSSSGTSTNTEPDQARLTWIAVCVMATTQLLRWPAPLKSFLRRVRTICGPGYSILICGACYKETMSCVQDQGPFLLETTASFYTTPTLFQFAAFSSVLASVLFRPDNRELWKAAGRCLVNEDGDRNAVFIPSAAVQKQIHATLMVCSFGCMVAKFAYFANRSYFYHHNGGDSWHLYSLGWVLIGVSVVGSLLGVKSIRTGVSKRNG